MTAPPKGEPLAGRARCAVRLGPIGRKAPGPARMGNNALTKGAWQTAVNLNRGARSFPDAKNFARPAQSLPARQWSSSLCRYSRHLPPAGGSLSYQGSWREAPERLYYMLRLRFALPFSGRLILRTTSPSPSVTPLLVGEALALRKLHLFASGSPTREAGGRKPD